MNQLTKMQRNYIWLMGSFPDKQMFQGRGKRSSSLMYAITEDELYIFGYSTPCYFMRGRYVTAGQAPHSWNLTEAGEAEFKRLLGSGGVTSTEFLRVELKDK